MLESDLLIAACSTAISHTESFRRAHEKGMRYLAMGGLTLDLLTNGAATADYDELEEITKKIAVMVTKSSKVKVTSEFGTDITFSIEGRPAFPLAGRPLPETKYKAAFPDG